MRLLVFSDLHGNSYALDAFLERIRGEEYDQLIFCGDIFGYYYNQHEIIKKLAQIDNLVWLKGNHDAYFLRLFCGAEEETDYVNNYGHSYADVRSRFTQQECDRIAECQPEYIIAGEDCRIGVFHGTPQDPLEGRLYPKDAVADLEEYQQYDIVILGHTHCRMKRFVGNTLVVNSGSLGQPRDGNGFGYAVIDTVGKKVRFEGILLDTTELYRQIDRYDAGLAKLKGVLERRKEDFI